MIWVTFCSAALGLATALAAVGRLPDRLPDRRLTLVTGPVAALVGGLVSRVVLGPGNLPAVLVAAVLVSVAMLSLLLGENTGPSGLRTEPVARPRV